MIDLVRGIADLHPRNKMFRKDVSAHHIPTPEVPSMQDILDAAEASENALTSDPDHYGYLRNIGVSNDDLASQLRQRAMLMRQRADEFDEIADRYREQHLRQLESVVRSYDETTISIIRLLKEHKHVEPTKV